MSGRPARAARPLLERLEALADPANVAGMARYGINPAGTLGVPMPALRALAREVRRDGCGDGRARHALARELWGSGIHEARILAALVDDPARVTGAQMERWARAFDSWDVCDQVCMNLFERCSRFTTRRRAIGDSTASSRSWSGRRPTSAIS